MKHLLTTQATVWTDRSIQTVLILLNTSSVARPPWTILLYIHSFTDTAAFFCIPFASKRRMTGSCPLTVPLYVASTYRAHRGPHPKGPYSNDDHPHSKLHISQKQMILWGRNAAEP